MATDRRLDQTSTLTDFDYAIIVKGTNVAKVTKNQLAELVGNLLYGATTKETLASVVAGQIGVNGHDKLNGTSYINNADERTVLSVFRGNNDNVNTPEKYGLMVVYSALGYVNQTFYSSIYKGRIYQRFYGDSSWSSWQRIDCIQ